MTAKHKADELADKLPEVVKAEYYESGGDIWADITDEAFKAINEAATLLRTIPSLEAEIVSLKNKVFELEEKLFSSEIIDIDSDRSKLIIELAKSIEKNDLSFFKKMMKRGKHETI